MAVWHRDVACHPREVGASVGEFLFSGREEDMGGSSGNSNRNIISNRSSSGGGGGGSGSKGNSVKELVEVWTRTFEEVAECSSSTAALGDPRRIDDDGGGGGGGDDGDVTRFVNSLPHSVRSVRPRRWRPHSLTN